MGILVIFLGILGFYFVTIKYLNISSEKCLFVLISTFILLLYWFAYFNLLLPGAWLILLFGLFALIALPFILLQDREVIFTKYITPVFVFTLVYIVVLSLLSMGLHVSGWDEFSHWGPYAKYMLLHNGFIQAKDIVVLKSYPPGGSLFYYLFYLVGGFSEAKTYIAQQLLMLSAIPVILKNIDWKDWPLAFLGYSFLLLILKFFHAQIGYTGSLYMDVIIGVYFGCIIVCYRLSNRKSSDILLLIPPIFALSIFKLHLFPMILAITVFIVLDQLLQAFYFLQDTTKTLSILTKYKIIFGRIFGVLLIPASSLLAIISWNDYLKKANIPVAWDLHVTKAQLFNLFAGKGLDTTKLMTITHYKHMLLGRSLVFMLSCIVLAILTFILCKQKKDKRAIILDNTFMFLGFVGYLFLLLLMYVFLFGAYEGPRLASVGRYLSIYYIAWSMVIIVGLFKALESYKFIKKRSIQLFFASLIILVMAVNTTWYYYNINRSNIKIRSKWRLRQAIQQITNKVKLHTNLKDRIFVVWQNDYNYVPLVIQYELIPRFMVGRGSFIKHPSATNVWAKCWSSKKFANELKNYDYLLLGYTDKEFWQMFGVLFPAKPPYLKPLVNYKICMGTGFCPVCSKNGKLKTEQAYLLKICKKNGKIRLVNVR